MSVRWWDRWDAVGTRRGRVVVGGHRTEREGAVGQGHLDGRPALDELHAVDPLDGGRAEHHLSDSKRQSAGRRILLAHVDLYRRGAVSDADEGQAHIRTESRGQS